MTQAASESPAKALFGSGPTPRYPAPEPGSPRAKALAEQMLHHHRSGPRVIPPERRLVVSGHSAFCPSCERFSRRGGGCAGVRGGSDGRPPACHVDAETGRMDSPFEEDGRGGLRLVAGQERFWRFGQIAPNAWAVVAREADR